MKNFEEIYHKYVDLVYNLSLQYVYNEEDAKEITQDVFVKVHRHNAKFEGRSSMKTWIYRMTINTCLDFIKAKKTIKRQANQNTMDVADPIVFNQIQDFQHPGILMEQKEALAGIFAAMEELNENQRTSIVLLKIEGLSQIEAAKVMDITPKALESLFHRAKKKLWLILEESKDSDS